MSNASNILSTISAFLDTCPDIPEGVPVTVGPATLTPEGLAQYVTIGEERYLVTVTRLDAPTRLA